MDSRLAVAAGLLVFAVGLFFGANKFNEEGRRSVLAKAGFHDISGLREDRQRVWHGTAKQGGRLVAVSVDFYDHIEVADQGQDGLSPS
jgi:uncharacterized membrane protein YiaA